MVVIKYKSFRRVICLRILKDNFKFPVNYCLTKKKNELGLSCPLSTSDHDLSAGFCSWYECITHAVLVLPLGSEIKGNQKTLANPRLTTTHVFFNSSWESHPKTHCCLMEYVNK